LQGCGDIAIFCGGDGLEKHRSAVASVKVDLLFGLQTEIEFISTTKAQDVGVIVPSWCLQGNSWIKSRNGEFENSPEQVITIFGLEPNGAKFRVDFRI
jgi:hypothetical protein